MLRLAALAAGATAAGVVAGHISIRALRGEIPYYDFTGLQFEVASATGPFLRLLDPETSHKIGIWSARHGLFPRETRPDDEALRIRLWNRDFSNPFGIAAGFDKDAEAAAGLLGTGFGFIEVGSITPEPQPGNDKPRVFRLPEHRAVINRYGFNSKGLLAAKQNVERFRSTQQHDAMLQRGVLGINLGKNKTTEDAAADYVKGLRALGPLADFIVVNVSSPNTPGLRTLQGKQQLEDLVSRVKRERDSMSWGEKGAPPLLVKVAPDLDDNEIKDVADVAMSQRIDGIVVSNTTISRPDSIAGHARAKEAGGLSGEPLRELATHALRRLYAHTRGSVPLVGCGGICSGADAYARIRAGASLVEVYTAMIYEGPTLVRQMKRDVLQRMRDDGFTSLQQAIGADYRDQKTQ